MEDIRIKIISEDGQLDGTTAKLKKLGTVSDDNAIKFTQAGKKHNEALKETKGEVGRLEDKMRNLGERIVAIFAVERIFEFASEAVKAFEAAEKSAKDLEFTIIRVNNESTKAFEKLIRQSEDLSKVNKNLYTPKQIQDADKILALQKLSSEQIRQALPLLIDFAAKTGKTLPEAADNFGRAISEGVTRPLTEVGMKFTSTGDPIKDFNILMQEAAKFTGGAKDALETYSGKSQQTSNEVEVLSEELGKKLAPAWEATKKATLEASNALADWLFQGGMGSMAKIIENNKQVAKEVKEVKEKEVVDIYEKIHHEENYNKFSKKSAEERLRILQDNSIKLVHFNTQSRESEIKEVELYLKKLEDDSKKAYEKKKAVELKRFDDDYARAVREFEALQKLTLKGQTPKEKATTDYIDELKQAGIYGKQRSEMTALEYQASIAAENDFNKTIKEIDEKDAKDRLSIKIKLLEEENNQNLINSKQKLLDEKITDQEYLIEVDKFNIELLEKEQKAGDDSVALQQKIEQAKQKLQEDSKAKEEKKLQERLDVIKQFSSLAINQFNTVLQQEIYNIDHKEVLQQASIKTQQGLAERGLANDLAFEQRKQAELEKQRMKDLQKMKKAKELETFLNSVAEFSKTSKSPGEAVAKAIAQLALVRGAEALFMEEGGVVGNNNQRSYLGRRHKSGNDVFIQAEKGEGMLSVKEMHNLGGEGRFMDLKKSLSMPIGERGIPIAAVITQTSNNKEVIYHLQQLTKTIKDKPDFAIDFDKFGNFIGTITKNGISEATKYIIPKRGI